MHLIFCGSNFNFSIISDIYILFLLRLIFSGSNFNFSIISDIHSLSIASDI